MNKAIWLAVVLMSALPAVASAGQVTPKTRVADLIRRVEDGVDQFRDYLEKRGDDAREKGGGARRRGSAGKTEERKDKVEKTKDELDDALGDLNRSTNRLRRKFDVTDTWMETKPMVESIVDDGRRINQYVARGNYGSEVARLWAALRTQINDLARAYGVPPMAR